jgi:hypothetical protein
MLSDESPLKSAKKRQKAPFRSAIRDGVFKPVTLVLKQD